MNRTPVPDASRKAVRCTVCGRIVCYKMGPANGFVEQDDGGIQHRRTQAQTDADRTEGSFGIQRARHQHHANQRNQ